MKDEGPQKFQLKVDLISLSDLVGLGGKSESFEMSKTEVGLALFGIIRIKWLGVHVPMPENGSVFDHRRQIGIFNDFEVRELKLRFSLQIDLSNTPFIDG